MSSAARIEELQKKFDENPRRYFAPLANECRKAGDLDAAIAICRTHLPQQPGHMSGHIVYGQALFESGDLDEAQTVFETALGLDPENLIALRHMGDIAARRGDMAGARQWYDRVLETDPRNEEIQSLVAGLEQQPAPGSGGQPTEFAAAPALADFAPVEPARAEAPVESAPAEPDEIERAFDAPAAEAEELPRVRGGLPTLVDPALLAAAADAVPEGSVPAAPDWEDRNAPDALDFDDAGAVSRPLVTSEFEAAAGADTPRDALLEPTALEFEAPAESRTMEGLEATTFEAPSADEASAYERVGDEALLDGIEGGAPQLEGLETAEFDASGYGGSGLEPIAGPSFEFEPADAGPLQDPPSVDSAPPPPEAFVTETMAELYLRQGYRDEALEVYRKLVSQSPGDEDLRARLERLESELATGPVDGSTVDARSIDAEGDDVIAGLPRAIEPALVAAAAEAGPGESGPGRDGVSAGPTIREYLAALATGAALPSGASADEAVEPDAASGDWPADDAAMDWPATETADAGAGADADWPAADADADWPAADADADWPAADAADADYDVDAVAALGPSATSETGEIAEVVDLGEFDLADADGGATPRSMAAGGLDALFDAPDEADVRAADALAAAYQPYESAGSDEATSLRPSDGAGGGDGYEGQADPGPVDEPPVDEPPPEAGEPEADPLRGRPARPAGNDLSLDHVFGAPRHQGAQRNTGGFSFDQFFSEGAAKPAREEAPEPPAATGDEEDLEQFNSWLHNLRKQ